MVKTTFEVELSKKKICQLLYESSNDDIVKFISFIVSDSDDYDIGIEIIDAIIGIYKKDVERCVESDIYAIEMLQKLNDLILPVRKFVKKSLKKLGEVE